MLFVSTATLLVGTIMVAVSTMKDTLATNTFVARREPGPHLVFFFFFITLEPRVE